MQLHRNPLSLPDGRPAVVTVGSFDGVHRGHRALLDRLVREARRHGGTSVAVTFEPHPRIALGRADGLLLLTDTAEKAELLAACGVDHLVVLPFDRTLASLPGAVFVDEYLCRRLRAAVLVAGYDHRFGHDRIAAETLASERLRIVGVGPCEVGGRAVSSTAIRRAIEAGRLQEAEELLGHPIALTRRP